MKRIRTEEAVGHVLCHDMTQIIPGQYKDARFRKGHVVREEDIPVLPPMGKESLYVWEMVPGMVHEDDAAERLCALCRNEHMDRSAVKEGKIELTAAIDGLFRVDRARLDAVNALEDIMIATRHGDTAVRRGDKLAGTRVIPLIVEDEKLRQAEAAAGDAPLLELLPWKLKTAGIVTTAWSRTPSPRWWSGSWPPSASRRWSAAAPGTTWKPWPTPSWRSGPRERT